MIDKIEYLPNFINGVTTENFINSIPWDDAGAPRMECFMSDNPEIYGYDTKQGIRTYESHPYNDFVKYIREQLNITFKSKYNVCFLNYYLNEKQHLGWHSDNSPGMDLEHPIAVISFGESRDIYVKVMGDKGVVPDNQKFKLEHGSLFIMPAGFQKHHLHKIPKGDRVMGPRVSLTFRHYVPTENF